MTKRHNQPNREWAIPLMGVAPGDLGRQLGAARRSAGLTQAQVARLEQRDYHGYTLRSLRRYIEALGAGYSLAVAVRRGDTPVDATPYLVAAPY
ncbi:MAG: helix-turn-helix domain-containing protein [Thermomicrobiales bacterium]